MQHVKRVLTTGRVDNVGFAAVQEQDTVTHRYGVRQLTLQLLSPNRGCIGGVKSRLDVTVWAKRDQLVKRWGQLGGVLAFALDAERSDRVVQVRDEGREQCCREAQPSQSPC